MLEWVALIVLIPVVLLPVVLLFGFAGCSLLVDGAGDDGGEPEFEESFAAPLELTGTQKREERSIVVRIEPGPHLKKGGSQVRITIQGPTDGEVTIKALYISQVSDMLSDAYDAAEDLTLVVDDHSLTGVVELDAVTYSLDHTKALLLAFDIGESGDVLELSNLPQGMATSFVGPRAVGQNAPIHEAQTDDRQSGYQPEENRIYLVKRIEVAPSTD